MLTARCLFIIDKNVSETVTYFESLSGIISMSNIIKIDMGETYQITDAGAVQWSSVRVIASCKTSKNQRWNSWCPPKNVFVFHIAFLMQIRTPICQSLSVIFSDCWTAFLLLCLPQWFISAAFPCQRFSPRLNGVVREMGQQWLQFPLHVPAKDWRGVQLRLARRAIASPSH